MRTRKTNNIRWNEYDKLVGRNQLLNYGVIFIDKYGYPIEDEYELERLNEKFLWKKEDIKIIKGEK